MEIAIGALERGVRTLAKKLEKLGLKTEITVFKTGPGGTAHYGSSYVELEVTGTCQGADGEPEEAYATVKFLAGGYGDLHTPGRNIGGMEGWRPMSAEGLKRILAQLESDGWKRPG